MAQQRILLDDRLLIEHVLFGLTTPPSCEVCTTSYWFYRACRAAVAGAGGHLSGPFQGLQRDQQERAVLALLALPESIVLPDHRVVVPQMAEIARELPHLNLLNLEAVASALTWPATVWLSEAGAAGILVPILDAKGVAWRTVAIG